MSNEDEVIYVPEVQSNREQDPTSYDGFSWQPSDTHLRNLQKRKMCENGGDDLLAYKRLQRHRQLMKIALFPN